jgi:hypothetical protein
MIETFEKPRKYSIALILALSITAIYVPISLISAPASPKSTEPMPTLAELTISRSREPTLTEPEPTQPTRITKAPLISTEVAIILAVAFAYMMTSVALWALQKRK